MRILEHCYRVYADLAAFDETIAFYEQLQGVKCARRVSIVETGVLAAKIGAFLLLAGTPDQLAAARSVDAIFYLDSLDEFVAWLETHGAEIIHPPRVVTSGRNLTARHPDGLVVEYFEAAPAGGAVRS